MAPGRKGLNMDKFAEWFSHSKVTGFGTYAPDVAKEAWAAGWNAALEAAAHEVRNHKCSEIPGAVTALPTNEK